MSKILCFSHSPMSEIVEKFISNKTDWSMIFHSSLRGPEILEEEPGIVIISESEIEALLIDPVFSKIQGQHRFAVIGFIQNENLEQRLNSYRVGAQDCLSMAMSPEEMSFKLNILLEQARVMKSIPPSLQFKNLTLFPTYRRVLINDQEIRLAQKEFEILHLLLKERERFVTTEELGEIVWKDPKVSSGNIYTQFYNLKKRLKAFDGKIITAYGGGFKIEG